MSSSTLEDYKDEDAAKVKTAKNAQHTLQ